MENAAEKVFAFPEGIRPWGRYEVLLDSPRVKVKRITVKSGARLSLQKHAFRQEHWVCVDGKGRAFCGKKSHWLERGQEVSIPRGAVHRLENDGKDDLVIIETQIGDYFGEDDIVRLEDDFGRN